MKNYCESKKHVVVFLIFPAKLNLWIMIMSRTISFHVNCLYTEDDNSSLGGHTETILLCIKLLKMKLFWVMISRIMH